MHIWVKQKAQETVPFYLFYWPSVPVSLLKEHTTFPCVTVACRDPLPSPTSDGLCLHLTLHKMDNEEDMYCVLSPQFLFCLPSRSGCLNPSATIHETLIQWSVDLESCSGSTISHEKALTPTMAPEEEDKKKEWRKINCLIRASGKKSATPMHTPGFCQADRHDNHVLVSHTRWAMLDKTKCS